MGPSDIALLRRKLQLSPQTKVLDSNLRDQSTKHGGRSSLPHYCGRGRYGDIYASIARPTTRVRIAAPITLASGPKSLYRLLTGAQVSLRA